ncbi:MAG: protein translocase SEC61 complex subunit gamma [Candidatus Diapherotrites archaeon]
MINKESLENFYNSSLRIFNVSRKPTMQEYKLMAKVVGVGIIIIGFIGFFLKLIFEILF